MSRAHVNETELFSVSDDVIRWYGIIIEPEQSGTRFSRIDGVEYVDFIPQFDPVVYI